MLNPFFLLPVIAYRRNMDIAWCLRGTKRIKSCKFCSLTELLTTSCITVQRSLWSFLCFVRCCSRGTWLDTQRWELCGRPRLFDEAFWEILAHGFSFSLSSFYRVQYKKMKKRLAEQGLAYEGPSPAEAQDEGAKSSLTAKPIVGRLTDDRIHRLESIGFVWSLRWVFFSRHLFS
jgi:hypothetical protein